MKKGLLLNLSPLIKDYKMVSAHEILLAYGGHIYSKTLKRTSHWSMVIQDPDEDAKYIPKTGEIDFMKYAEEQNLLIIIKGLFWQKKMH